MGVILFACANEELAKQIEQVLDPSDEQKEIIVTSRASFADDLQKIEKEISLIVSRGALGRHIAQNFPFHVILMRISLIDILKSVAELKREGAERIAVIGSSAWIDNDFGLCDEETIGFTLLIAETDEARTSFIENLKTAGFDALITIGTGIELAKQYGLKVRSLITTPSSITASYNEAKFISSVIRNEQLRSNQVRILLDGSDDALVMLSQNQVVCANVHAKHLFETENLTYQAFIPYLNMRNTPAKVGEVQVLVTSTPYSISPKTFGHIISFKEIANIQKNEKIVRQSQQRGFVAKATFNSIIYESETMKRCIEDALQYSRIDSPVLITGETGSGKELFAQSIHNASTRRNRPFVSINCGAIPPSLLESELFGYVDGAFTGAKKNGKYGLFELANTGTLFLDEIGEMPLELQSRLLRVLQEKELMRIGDDKVIPIDVRVLCATNRNLIHCIEDGTFRADLYYRINVLKINVPPLRERPADIEHLFMYFLHIFSQKYSKNIQNVSGECIEVLEQYGWPGNVRELMNLAERAVALCNEEVISPSFMKTILNSEIQKQTSKQLKPPPKKRITVSKEKIEKLLSTHSTAEVCEMLGISRTTLWRIRNR